MFSHNVSHRLLHAILLSLVSPWVLAQQHTVSLTSTPEYPICGQEVVYRCTTTDMDNQGFEVIFGRTILDVSRGKRCDETSMMPANLSLTLEADNKTALLLFRASRELKGNMITCSRCSSVIPLCSRDMSVFEVLQAARAPMAPIQQNLTLLDYLGNLLGMGYQNLASGNHSNDSVFAGLAYSSPEAEQYVYTLYRDGIVIVNITTDSVRVAVGAVEPDERWTGEVRSFNESSPERGSCFSENLSDPDQINLFGRYLVTRDIQCEDGECTVNSTIPLVSVTVTTGDALEAYNLTSDNEETGFYQAVFTVNPSISDQPALYNASFQGEFGGEYLATLNVTSDQSTAGFHQYHH